MKLFKELPKSIFYSLLFKVISKNKLVKGKKNVPLIVSLTSIPSRLNTLDIVIKSLLNQSILPQKITLWLHYSLEEKIPKKLFNLQSEVFEIKFSALKCSHRKLIHSLYENPLNTIVTCDDDQMYHKDWLVHLYKEHQKYPQDIIANRVVEIKTDNSGSFLPYKQWKKISSSTYHKSTIGIGSWGILYPPNSLSTIIFDEKLFMKLTPKADDLWFKGMSLLNNTSVRKSSFKTAEPIPIIGSQKKSLKKENVHQNKNDLQWQSLVNYFNLKELLSIIE